MIKSETDLGDGFKIQVVAGTDEMIERGLIPGKQYDEADWHISMKGTQ